MGKNHLITIALMAVFTATSFASNDLGAAKQKRSIDLSAALQSIPLEAVIGRAISINHYLLDIRPNFEDNSFCGTVKINISIVEDAKEILLHVFERVKIQESTVKVRQITGSDDKGKELKIRRVDRNAMKPLLEIYFVEPIKKGSLIEITTNFEGEMWEAAIGLFRGSYMEKDGKPRKFVSTQFRPTGARRVFPCIDHPSHKATFTLKIARPKQYRTIFVTPLKNTTPIEGNENYVLDEFETTPPMSTYALGFLISEMTPVSTTFKSKWNVNIYSREDIKDELKGVYEKVDRIMNSLVSYLDTDYPLKKLDIVALPVLLDAIKPVDGWGLIVFKESDILSKGYYNLAQEIVYNWIGNWVTPNGWTSAETNKALAGFLATKTTLEMDNGREFEGKYPMTILYSIYYEFSKRYPHSKITGMKQETTCSKTELVLRMINFTIGGETFKKGIQNFLQTYKFKTFRTEDFYEALTKQAHADKVLCDKLDINEIANSWSSKDRIPVVTVKRDYKGKSALVTQRTYLRERPHDLPDHDKLMWYIPLVVAQQGSFNFANYTPFAWMKNEKQITLKDLPDADHFVIVNPEEIGPFPVNYDDRNWNLIASFLQTDRRTELPVYTRAKLLHDAWNLAYGGNLSFATALDMTLFIKHERHHLVWNPVFTFIDHIGRHIDMSSVHKKFETYVMRLLTPLYEELGPEPVEGEENWKTNLRALSKTFLCRAGYKPCIEEAQKAYKKWMDSDRPDEGNPVANQYICPVFKWGTIEEWQFGLNRVINFPESRTQSERTYLLKTLAGCPLQKEKIVKLLNLTILEENRNFTETDINLIFKMLAGGSSGYATLFKFLEDNFDLIRERLKEKPNLWNNLISSSTGVFTTQEGYDMVNQLYHKHKGNFATAEHIIQKSLKNIKEETKWSNENLPVIEKWLDNYLKQESSDDVKFMGKK